MIKIFFIICIGMLISCSHPTTRTPASELITPDVDKIIVDYYKKNNVQTVEGLVAKIILRYPSQFESEKVDLKVAILFRVYELGHLQYKDLVKKCQVDDVWEDRFANEFLANGERAKKMLPLLDEDLRKNVNAYFLRYHLGNKKLLGLWQDNTFLRNNAKAYLYAVNYAFKRDELLPRTFDIIDHATENNPNIMQFLMQVYFDEAKLEVFEDNYIQAQEELSRLNFYNNFEKMSAGKKIKYLDFFEVKSKILDASWVEKILNQLGPIQRANYPRLMAHTKNESSDIDLLPTESQKVQYENQLKTLLESSQTRLDQLKAKYNELTKLEPTIRDPRYDRYTTEEENLIKRIAQEQSEIQAEITPLVRQQEQIKREFQIALRNERFRTYFPNIQDKISKNLPITKNRTIIITASPLVLASDSSKSTNIEQLSHKDFLQLINRSDPTTHIDLVSKFCFPQSNNVVIPSRSKLYTCLEAINLAFDKKPLSFEDATIIEQHYMRYIASDEFEGYFDFRQTKKTVKELEIEEGYIRVYEKFAKNNSDLSLRTFGETKGVLLNLGLSGKCLDALRYFLRRN
jgi:hypothetical protein